MNKIKILIITIAATVIGVVIGGFLAYIGFGKYIPMIISACVAGAGSYFGMLYSSKVDVTINK